MKHHHNDQEVQDKITVGERLRNAREAVGLSQQEVADKLYLKVSVIQNIEKNYIHPSVSLIFFRGYIRSYAKLLKISDKEISFMLSENFFVKHLQTLKQPHLSFKKIDFSDENWVSWVMWIIFFVVIILVFIYYWYCYQADQQIVVNNNHENLFLENFESNELNLMSIVGIFIF